MELYQPQNLLSDNYALAKHLRETGAGETVTEYFERIYDVEVSLLEENGLIPHVINSYIRMNEIAANLELLSELAPTDSKLAHALDKAALRFEMNVQRMASKPFFEAISGEERRTQKSMKNLYPYLRSTHNIFHEDMKKLSKDPILAEAFADGDENVRQFVLDTLVPRILKVDAMLAEDMVALSPERYHAANDTASGGPGTPKHLGPMDVNSVHAASVKGPKAKLAIRFPSTERE